MFPPFGPLQQGVRVRVMMDLASICMPAGTGSSRKLLDQHGARKLILRQLLQQARTKMVFNWTFARCAHLYVTRIPSNLETRQKVSADLMVGTATRKLRRGGHRSARLAMAPRVARVSSSI